MNRAALTAQRGECYKILFH